MATARLAREAIETPALLVGRVDYGEADYVVTLLTEARGKVSALARGARRSKRRFAGSLEPMHTLQVRLEERPSGDLFALRDAALLVTRRRLVMDLDALEGAGRALGWCRRAAPTRQPDAALWKAVETLLDRLDEAHGRDAIRQIVAEEGLTLLGAFGWAYEFERCVRCGKVAPEGRAAQLDPRRGGLVCRACGGAETTLAGAQRERFIAVTRGEHGVLLPGDTAAAVDLVERALRVHAGLD